MFYGRQAEISRILTMIDHPQQHALMLFGPRCCGKTTLLKMAQARLEDRPDTIPIYFDLKGKAALTLDDVLNDLTVTTCRVLGRPIPDRETFDANNDYFYNVLLGTLPNFNLVFLFDEFDPAPITEDEQAIAYFYVYLRHWLYKTRHKMIIVLGGDPNDLTGHIYGTLRHLPVCYIPSLDPDSSRAMLRASARQRVESIQALTGGHPGFNHLLCQTTLESAMVMGAPVFERIWHGLPAAERILAAALAEAGERTISHAQLERILQQIGLPAGTHDPTPTAEALQEWQVLSDVQPLKSYTFQVELFRLWIAGCKPLMLVKAEVEAEQIEQAEAEKQSVLEYYRTRPFEEIVFSSLFLVAMTITMFYIFLFAATY